jgi:Protein of unknown function (DUF4240)
MDYELFWHLVDSTRGEPDHGDALAKVLEQQTPDDIIRFRLLFDDVIHTAATVDLWGAAYTINGGCSDDGFFYFREALVGRGRAVFEAAVEDPDSLADAVTPGEELEGDGGLEVAARIAWVAKTGGTDVEFYEAVERADDGTDRGGTERGEWWNFDDDAEVRHRLPRLAAKFLTDDDE